MLNYFRRKKLFKLALSAKSYLEQHYQAHPLWSPDSEYPLPRIDTQSEEYDEDEIRFSLKADDEEQQGETYDADNDADEDSGIRFSLKEDNYNEKVIHSEMRRLSPTGSTSRILGILEQNTDMPFVSKMLYYIDKKNLIDVDVYKAAQIDRRLYSKIISDRSYKPAKDTCIALCLAMKLNIGEAGDLLSRAGYTLSHSNKRDVIIEFFFMEHVYNLNDVNDILYRLNQKTLGR